MRYFISKISHSVEYKEILSIRRWEPLEKEYEWIQLDECIDQEKDVVIQFNRLILYLVHHSLEPTYEESNVGKRVLEESNSEINVIEKNQIHSNQQDLKTLLYSSIQLIQKQGR